MRTCTRQKTVDALNPVLVVWSRSRRPQPWPKYGANRELGKWGENRRRGLYTFTHTDRWWDSCSPLFDIDAACWLTGTRASYLQPRLCTSRFKISSLYTMHDTSFYQPSSKDALAIQTTRRSSLVHPETKSLPHFTNFWHFFLFVCQFSFCHFYAYHFYVFFFVTFFYTFSVFFLFKLLISILSFSHNFFFYFLLFRFILSVHFLYIINELIFLEHSVSFVIINETNEDRKIHKLMKRFVITKLNITLCQDYKFVTTRRVVICS